MHKYSELCSKIMHCLILYLMFWFCKQFFINIFLLFQIHNHWLKVNTLFQVSSSHSIESTPYIKYTGWHYGYLLIFCTKMRGFIPLVSQSGPNLFQVLLQTSTYLDIRFDTAVHQVFLLNIPVEIHQQHSDLVFS